MPKTFFAGGGFAAKAMTEDAMTEAMTAIRSDLAGIFRRPIFRVYFRERQRFISTPNESTDSYKLIPNPTPPSQELGLTRTEPSAPTTLTGSTQRKLPRVSKKSRSVKC